MLEDTIRIIRINEHVQHGGKLYLHGKEVQFVTSTGSCLFVHSDQSVQLTRIHMQDLYAQTYGTPPQTKALSSRDTQFAGFAKLLFDDLNNNALTLLADHPDFDRQVELQKEINKKVHEIFAQRAYDLVRHTLNLVPQLIPATDHLKTMDEVVSYVPDLTAWPAQEETK